MVFAGCSSATTTLTPGTSPATSNGSAAPAGATTSAPIAPSATPKASASPPLPSATPTFTAAPQVTPTASATTPTSPNLVPASGIYLGAYVSTSGVRPPPLTDLPDFEAQVGRTMALTSHYYGFNADFPGAAEARDVAAGRIPIDAWDCAAPNATVAAGGEDDSIRRRADAVKAFGYPVFVRYMWEMNLPVTAHRTSCYSAASDLPNNMFSPVQYIAAWNHIRSIFAQEGVTNAVWLWNPSGKNDASAYYPGASEVDWVGLDKYDDANAPFADTYRQSYGFVASYGKPIMIVETGVEASIQPDFFAAAVSALQSQFPEIKAYVYFDAPGAKPHSWHLSTAGTQAFATMGADPYFAGRAP